MSHALQILPYYNFANSIVKKQYAEVFLNIKNETYKKGKDMKKISEILRVEDTTLEIIEKAILLDDDESIDYQEKHLLQAKMFEIAVKKAKTAYEYEECASSIEMHYYGDERDPYEWAEEIRKESFIVIGLEGLMAVVNKEKSKPAYQEFLNFLEVEGLENPVDFLVETLTDTINEVSE